MLAMIFLAFTVLVVRLYALQVVHGREYGELSMDNFVSERRIVAMRGMIYDRNGVLLADNKPSFELLLTPAFCPEKDFESVLSRLTEYLGLSIEEIEETRLRYESAHNLSRFVPFVVRSNMAWAELAMVEQNMDRLAGVEVHSTTRRAYPHKHLAAHLLGYVGQISPSGLARRKPEGYRQGDVVGKTGIEMAWEKRLRGTNGRRRVVVNARGQRMPDALAQKIFDGDGIKLPAEPGQNLILSLDARLQDLAEKRFPGREGAVVAVDPRDGFILAIASKPAFDLNLLSGRISPQLWQDMILDVDKPLTNRATHQHYPPGSTFKPVTALAALESGVLGPESKEICTGAVRFGDHNFRCWRSGGHGAISLHRAIVQSCDSYFYRAGMKAGLNAIAKMARSFGFGRVSGFRSCREVPGIMPDLAWYEKHSRWGFTPGMTLSDAIGQGDVNATPIQMALAYAALANGGTLYRPQIVRRAETPTGEVIIHYPPVVRGLVRAKKENLALLVHALAGVVNEPGGTAYYRRPRNVQFQAAGKTGTAQVVKQGTDRGRNLPYDFKDHAWFVGWAPVDSPKIVVAVINEHGGHGSSGAAPLVMELMTFYLEQLGEWEGENPAGDHEGPRL
jgi:penicillin-binding protein 2